MRPAAVLLAAACLAAAPAIAQDPPPRVADPCAPRGAPIPPPPVAAPTDFPPPVPYVPLRGMGAPAPLGIGHLRAGASPGASPDAGAEWFRRVEAPVYAEPGGDVVGWIASGWWVPAADPARAVPLATDPMVETGYEVASWIVAEAREGWVRFRFGEGDDGAGWAALCHLSASDPPVAYEPWEARFASEGFGPLFFRSPARHALRRGAGPEHRRTFWLVGGDATELQPLEVRGDWMRVRATSPPFYCADPPPTRALVEEGWVRWRDAETGPWVWWHTRGC